MTTGEPVQCKSCGGVFEGPVTFEVGDEIVSLPGHLQGGPDCKARSGRKVRPAKHRVEPTPDHRTVWDMSPEERSAKEAAVLASLKARP